MKNQVLPYFGKPSQCISALLRVSALKDEYNNITEEPQRFPRGSQMRVP